MVDNDNVMDSDTATSDTDTSTATDDNEDLEEGTEQDEISNDDPEEDGESETQKPVKDYKKAFNSVMSEKRKLERENEMLKSNKSGGNKVSDDDLATLRDKYDEEDLETIEKIINKKLDDYESNKLAQKEVNIFLKDHPETTDAQLKHLRFMQKEFGYSLKYAYDITFGGKSPKKTPADHSIWGWQGSNPVTTKKEESDNEAYQDMKKYYNA